MLLSVQRLMHRHLQGLLLLLVRKPAIALYLYSLIFLPGVALHETSHWLAAKLLRVRTLAFSLLPRKQGSKVRFGYVETQATDPIRAALIGMAPLVVGASVVVFVALDYLGLRSVLEGIAIAPLDGLQQGWETVASTPDLLVWLYLVFAISNTMLPSAADRAAWLPALALAAALAVGAHALGVADASASIAQPWLELAAENLSGVFVMTAVFDLALLVPILAAETFVTRLLGWEVVY